MDVKEAMVNGIGVYDRNIGRPKYMRKGILLSEGFAFCAIANALGVKRVIESGVHNGRSTEIFSLFGFEEIIAIERAKKPNEKKAFQMAQERLQGRGIRFIRGESSSNIQNILRKEEPKKTAIMIDGPKGVQACRMGRKFFKDESVCMVGIHDQSRNQFNHLMDQYFKNVFYTDTKWFRSKYSYLDSEDNEHQAGKKKLGQCFPDGAVIGIAYKD